MKYKKVKYEVSILLLYWSFKLQCEIKHHLQFGPKFLEHLTCNLSSSNPLSDVDGKGFSISDYS